MNRATLRRLQAAIRAHAAQPTASEAQTPPGAFYPPHSSPWLANLREYNHNHDERGRFSTADGAVSAGFVVTSRTARRPWEDEAPKPRAKSDPTLSKDGGKWGTVPGTPWAKGRLEEGWAHRMDGGEGGEFLGNEGDTPASRRRVRSDSSGWLPPETAQRVARSPFAVHRTYPTAEAAEDAARYDCAMAGKVGGHERMYIIRGNEIVAGYEGAKAGVGPASSFAQAASAPDYLADFRGAKVIHNHPALNNSRGLSFGDFGSLVTTGGVEVQAVYADGFMARARMTGGATLTPRELAVVQEAFHNAENFVIFRANKAAYQGRMTYDAMVQRHLPEVWRVTMGWLRRPPKVIRDDPDGGKDWVRSARSAATKFAYEERWGDGKWQPITPTEIEVTREGYS